MNLPVPNFPLNVLVIGYGSIGTRHARLLAELGCRVAILSRRPIEHPLSYQRLEEALEKEQPSYVVVANETSQHVPTLKELAALKFNGKLLVEKPLSDSSGSFSSFPFSHCAVGYHLRFHPVLQKLAECLSTETVISAQIYAGQYLPSWRPNRDYCHGYSANPTLGGGVLRDLSHELDMMTGLFGSWKRLTALGGKLSSLPIQSDDIWGILLSLKLCPVALIQINYLDHFARREMIVNTEQHTYYGNLMTGEFVRDTERQHLSVNRDQTYLDMHTAVLESNHSIACTLEQAKQIVRMIEAIEISNSQGTWIYS